jgi:hypothetical protein
MASPVIKPWSRACVEPVGRWLVGERTCDTDRVPALESSPSEVSALGAHASLSF